MFYFDAKSLKALRRASEEMDSTGNVVMGTMIVSFGDRWVS